MGIVGTVICKVWCVSAEWPFRQWC